MKKTFSIRDTDINFMTPDEPRGSDGDQALYAKVLTWLKDLGFTVTKNPRIEERHPILSPKHDAGHHGELKFQSEYYPAGGKFEFYQDVVYENRNGGFYDFDKLEKMPYLIRLRLQLTQRKIRALLLGEGLHEIHYKPKSPNPDPLAYFNAKWDMGEMARGEMRFDRGPDGWPSEKELQSWSRTDRDGNTVCHGDIRYFRDWKGYLRRARVYGGINGMWMCIYGPGRRDHTHLHVRELFTCSPAQVPRKVHPDRKNKLERQLRDAVATQNFERDIIVRDLLEGDKS